MYLITNRYLCSYNRYLEVLEEASFSGVENIILREKDLKNDELKNLYFKIRERVNKETKIIINGNYEVFNSVDADGIHMPFDMFKNLKDKLEYKEKIIGVSTHNIEEIIEVKKYLVSYLIFSHIYETKCKFDLKPKGISLLKKAQSELNGCDIKLIALGGILPNNAKETLNYCDDIAVMSSIMESDNVKDTIKSFL
ncbi:thiamine monophosphate synthase/TENI family protein [[Clostridium] bifermentans ATCC 638]|uniref:Thiamine monophosphate synthase/TENI family protein n=1 Tax=Paraclostridium bifermentans ATCC 638 = DSM 14991 TaxID=1233171 RepID=T4VTS8_PARBF|nr:thiamine phosphate synthase [Paraclostridium bifermentans]EQK44530.1 thiamine monophosphate synthase/TENI family protein [[Clostridium] bifermentans ATCC 638] [Paraclostridium bifermentans ATCC 638 = DSM 14991]RIZ57620.1 thiamine phosphate synthase [Paraclostridium bifermentans]UAG18631.1 thiamine phosphate synthase [Paraclostridium bifermentans]